MISMKWVKDYINLDGIDLNELAVNITKGGLNIEKVITNHIDNLVVGEVVECVDHPDSDHLHVCQVNDGTDKIRQIVCGASNVRAGIKVIVALPGAILPGDFEIKEGKIRGVESNGMICAKFELGLEEKNEETYAAGITELGEDAVVGSDPIAYLGLDDTIYDLDYHKRRNNDVYYHIGFAYEVAAVTGKKVTLPEAKYKEIKDNVNDYVTLKVDTDKCPFYMGKMVKNVKIGESPDWIKERIIAAGMRPINNVVDISNFVMLEYCQPTHFFDADKLGKNVLVRNAKDDETIVTLDGQNRELVNTDIVITDGKIPTCIAGVMGGENTEFDENTKNIFIEAAIFDSVAIRNTANRLQLKSEASTRYGKGLNHEYTIEAMNRCCSLLEQYAGGEVCSGVVLHDVVDKTEKKVEFTSKDISRVLGFEIPIKDIEEQLNKLEFEYKLEKEVFKVTIPRRRLDVDANIADIAEEIGRFYGYHNLVSTLPKVSTRRGVYVGDVGIRKNISRRLRSLGLDEVKTYTLTNPDMASKFNYENKEIMALPNPMSIDKSTIRVSLLPSLINLYEYNKARKVEDVNVYEIAKTYDKEFTEDTKISILMSGNYIINECANNIVKSDFYTLKGIIENLLDYLGFKNRYSFVKAEVSELHPGISAKVLIDREEVGIIGRVHPSYKKDELYVAELSMTKLYNKQIKPIKYKEASKYPDMIKDLAFVVENDVESEVIKSQIKKSGGRLLDSVEAFDIYKDIEPGKKSIAFKLVFKDPSKTLLETDVMEVFNKIIAEVEAKTSAKLRS